MAAPLNDFVVNSLGVSLPGNLSCYDLIAQVLSAAEPLTAPQAVSTGSAVIAVAPGFSVMRVSAAAATTGASLPAPTNPQFSQFLAVIVTSAAANTITFAAQGTSLVAGGAAVSLAGLAAHLFIWDCVGQLWYQVGPLTN